ncbi:MAG: ATPase, T2SS/T4P/T4SS family [Candidatus Nanoarchaeia archaeon]|nr:ATPase, T2SS/T4P/T4SS family [Candidatus Nanoarchaeia archaeon]MDD5239347.1 ATPase, T2SS/T4P/T4SS family [Candidatus Nanoarchaeia archaeon]
MEKAEVDRYNVMLDNIPIEVSIRKEPDEFTLIYSISLPTFEEASMALIEELRDRIITTIPVKLEVLRDPVALEETRKKIKAEATKLLKRFIKEPSQDILEYTSSFLADEMLGLGNIEILLRDENLEEIVINGSKEPVWVYHKKFGWLKTNVTINNEAQIENYASIIGRRVGRQITVLDPLMDAHLITGDRVNATLFPISTRGNTLTIRKFRRKPWTITDLIKNNTINLEVASFFWLGVQYELSMLIGGGTASGKTTFLNVLMPFIPPNERIISIEDTRELTLPKFLHWVPLTTREPNPEGKGEVTMLDLLINSLRMRPDRIVVGEIRRRPEAEVLFEALNTGHSVYSTLHANTAEEAFRRLTSPPIDLPPELIQSLPLFGVMFRHRKLRIRRLFEISELVNVSEKGSKANMRRLYSWSARTDKISKDADSIRVADELNLFTGMTKQEIKSNLDTKQEILKWMVKNSVDSVDDVGKVISHYYTNENEFFKILEKKDAKDILLKYTGGPENEK